VHIAVFQEKLALLIDESFEKVVLKCNENMSAFTAVISLHYMPRGDTQGIC
jgi:hypothetical protein